MQGQRANTACTRLVGVGAFLGSLRGLSLVPANWRCLVPPTSTPQGHNASRWLAYKNAYKEWNFI